MEMIINEQVGRFEGSNLQMASNSILLVEDESDIRDLIFLHLVREGYKVTAVANGEEGLSEIAKKGYDLLVLDWMLPGVSGLEITKMVRQGAGESEVNSDVPILMVTAKAESRDIIDGLESGADDYLTKPFEIPVLVARVKALIRRSQVDSKPETEIEEIKFANFTIYPSMHEVYCDGEKMKLTRSEFRLIEALAKNQGRVLTRDSLIHLVQGDDVAVTARTIDTHVFGLRKKMGVYADIIETIRGVGYRIPLGR